MPLGSTDNSIVVKVSDVTLLVLTTGHKSQDHYKRSVSIYEMNI